MKSIFSLCLILSLLLALSASASENTNNAMVSGSFGVAWISDGTVQLYDGMEVIALLPGIKIYAIAAADFLEEGSDQLAYLNDGRTALHIYSFKTQNTIGPFGHNVRTMTVGHCASDETFPSLFVCTFSGDSFLWTKEVMGGGWISIPGDFVQASRGRFDRQGNLDDFVTVNGEGQVYIYATRWQTYSRVEGANGIVAVLAGNFTASPGDEVAMFDKDGSVFLYQSRTLEGIKQKAKCLAVGRNLSGLDTLYALDKEGKIVRYDRETKTWKRLLAESNLVFTNLIAKDAQTLFAVSNGNLYKISGDRAEQLSSLAPMTVVLQKDGKPLVQYRYTSVPFKPYIDELRTPSGKNILRDAPWDHLHHHGLMYALRVGNCSFWGEWSEDHGKQDTVQISFTDNAVESQINWNAPGAGTVLKEARKITVEQGNNVTLLNWQSTLTATADTVLGGDHYYGLGLRFLEEMDTGGRFFSDTDKNEKEIVRGDEALTRCRWMAYTAKLDGEPVTVAVFDHPSNPVPMTAFTMGDASDAFAYLSAAMNLHRVPVELKSGGTFAVKYRVAVWDGEVPPETIEAKYREFVR